MDENLPCRHSCQAKELLCYKASSRIPIAIEMKADAAILRNAFGVHPTSRSGQKIADVARPRLPDFHLGRPAYDSCGKARERDTGYF